MTEVSQEFRDRWATGSHIGGLSPVQVVEVRKVRMHRGYHTWIGPAIGAKIPKETPQKPWMAWWEAEGPWMTLPAVLQTDLTQDFASSGIAVATIQLENVLYREASNLGLLYHLVERGALSPYRGYTPPGLPRTDVAPNEWADMLSANRQIRIWQGYGEDTLMPVFTGLIDDVDPTAKPDRVTVTCRDYGQVLTDEKTFGYVNGPGVVDPIFFRSGTKDNRVGEYVGYDAAASSTRPGYPPRFVTDKDKSTRWVSDDRSGPELTEWVEVKVPRGHYRSFLIHPAHGNMQVFVGIKATHRGILDQDPAELDGMNIRDGWVSVPADEGGGVTPGDTNGGWPYIKRWSSMSAVGRVYKLDHELYVGDDTVFRVGFRHLARAAGDTYRASVTRLAPVRLHRRRPVAVQRVGYDALASSRTTENFKAENVIDESIQTEWHSDRRSARDVTEWVQIRVPQGAYRSFRLYTNVDDMEMFVSIYAKNRRRKKGTKSDAYEEYPPQFEEDDIPEDWVDLGKGLVPGETNGGIPYVKREASVAKMYNRAFTFSLPGKFELGKDSIIRVHFRHLHPIADEYQARVGKLLANTRTGVQQPKPATKEEEDKEKRRRVIEVEDPSDIVRVVLRWAGFAEWNIENTGASLKGDWGPFSRQTPLRDIIAKVEEMTGYVFFMAPPTENDASVGIPTFRSALLLRDDLPDIPRITDRDLLTGIQAKTTDEPLASIIRVRGAKLKRRLGGQQFSIEKEYRVMSTYRPPWWPLGGMLRHVVHYEPRLKDQLSVDVMAALIALKEALASATATIEIPGTPEFDLDWQVALYDAGTGLNTRLYLASRSTVFVSGERPSYKTTLGGSLLDTPWIVGVKQHLNRLVPIGQSVASIGDIVSDMESD